MPGTDCYHLHWVDSHKEPTTKKTNKDGKGKIKIVTKSADVTFVIVESAPISYRLSEECKGETLQ